MSSKRPRRGIRSSEKSQKKTNHTKGEETFPCTVSINEIFNSEEIFRVIFDFSPVGIALVHTETQRFMKANRSFCAIVGYTEEELAAKTVADISHPDDWQHERSRVKPHLKGEQREYEIRKRFITKGGEIRHVQVSSNTMRAHGGALLAIGNVVDITDQIKTEKALRASEETYRNLFHNAQVGLFRTRISDGKVLESNEQLAIMFGYESREAFIAEYATFGNYVDPGTREKMVDELNTRGSVQNFEARFYRRDGSIFWISCSARIYRDQGWIEGVAEDITERKAAQEKLRESEEKYRTIFENAQDVFYETTLDGIILEISPSIEAFSRGQYTRAELLGKSLYEFYADPRERENLIAVLKERGAVTDFEISLRNKDGIVVPCSISSRLWQDSSGQLAIVIGSMRDISDRKRAEEALQNMQKLESLGVLAGGIAHDFNNLLGGIFGYIDMAFDESGENKVKTYLKKALGTIDRAKGLTQQLLTFAKGGVPVKKLQELTPFIQETAQFALSGSNCSCTFALAEDLWMCKFDRNQIGQVIDNILINAKQAMPEGGAIEVGMENVVLDNKWMVSLPAGPYVKISVKDRGAGMSPENLSKIFDPFYSTKPKGHGLGLTTCYSIIKRHGGYVDVESEPGEGSSFHIFLPASPDAIPEIPAKATAPHQGSGMVLVMDDEPVMRETIQSMLKMLGYSVVCTENGAETLNLLESDGAAMDITAMIFDLTIPGAGGGKDIIAGIRTTHRDIPVFVASGYADDPVMAAPEKYGFTASICKPFRKTQLAEMLRRYVKVRY
ncbi:MAG: PAS domain S-box protein [Chitinivibrionales bacterium]|nr:PAS domain S-box protein [Chitinivibrionales bacterium]